MCTPKIWMVPHLLPATPRSLHHLCSIRCSRCSSDSQTLCVHMIKPWCRWDNTTQRCTQNADAHVHLGWNRKQAVTELIFPNFNLSLSILKTKQISILENEQSLKQQLLFEEMLEVPLTSHWHSCRLPTMPWALQTPALMWPTRGGASSSWVMRPVMCSRVSILEPPTFSPSKPPPLRALAPLWA